MRNKFTELINADVAPAPVSKVFKNMSPNDMVDQRMDPIIQQYNAHWGMISNTFMEKDPNNPNQYIISGASLMTDQQWNEFCCSHSWNGYIFNFINMDGCSCTCSLHGWLEMMNMTVCHLNDSQYVVREILPEERTPSIKTDHYTTSESMIPRPMFEIETVSGEISDALKKETIKEVLESLNTNKNIIPKNWVWMNEMFVGKIGNKNIFIK